MLLDQQAQARLENLVAGRQARRPARRLQRTSPSCDSTKASSPRQHDARGAGFDLAAKRLHRGQVRAPSPRARQPCGSAVKRKPCSIPTCWPSTSTSPVAVISASNIAFSRKRRISTLVRRSTNRLRQTLVQSVRQLVLYKTRHALPMLRIRQPVRTVRDEGPSTDLRDARGQRVDLAIGAVERGHLRANQSGIEPAMAHQLRR